MHKSSHSFWLYQLQGLVYFNIILVTKTLIQNEKMKAIKQFSSSENISLQLVYNILDDSPRGPDGDNLIDTSRERGFLVSARF